VDLGESVKHHYIECDLCHQTDESQELKMFSYNPANKEKYILGPVDVDIDNDGVHICIKCINRIKVFTT